MKKILLICLLIIPLFSNALEKRDTVNDVDFDDTSSKKVKTEKDTTNKAAASPNAKAYNLPVVLPAYGHDPSLLDDIKPCMFYLEQVTVVVLDLKNIGTAHEAWAVTVGNDTVDTYNYAGEYVTCPNIVDKDDPSKNNYNLSFTVDINLKNPYISKRDDKNIFTVSGNLRFTLNLIENFGIDYVNTHLDEINIKVNDANSITNDLNNYGKTARNTSNPNIRAYYGYNYACGATQAIWFDGDEHATYLIGLVLNNVQIQSVGVSNNGTSSDAKYKLPYFHRVTADCQPTFSPGAWMGIITTLVLISGLLFGYLMVNNVQTMDRLDDPKQKPIVINFKE